MTTTSAPKTAEITALNSESVTFTEDGTAVTRSWDTITVFDAQGTEVDTVTVESAEDDAPYLAALAQAGHSDARLLPLAG